MFQERFAYFVDLTDTTITDLAQALSFDRSYVSKWYNGKSLPNIDSWDTILDAMASYFAQHMDEAAIKDFADLSESIEYALNYSSLEEVIASYIYDGYMQDSRPDQKTQDEFVNSAGLVRNVRQVKDIVLELIQMVAIRQAQEGGKPIYYAGDFIGDLGSSYLDEFRFTYTSDIGHILRSSLDLDSWDSGSEEAMAWVHSYFRICSQMPFLDLEVYDKVFDKDYSRMAAWDTIAAYVTKLDDPNEIECFIIRDKDKVNKMYEEIDEAFKPARPLIENDPNFSNVQSHLSSSRSDRPGLFLYHPSQPT